jgi:hypothetical protein
MKTKGLFMKVMLSNKDVKPFFFKPNFDIEKFNDSFKEI